MLKNNRAHPDRPQEYPENANRDLRLFTRMKFCALISDRSSDREAIHGGNDNKCESAIRFNSSRQFANFVNIY